MFEDRADVAAADEDGGRGDGRDGIATYRTHIRGIVWTETIGV